MSTKTMSAEEAINFALTAKKGAFHSVVYENVLSLAKKHAEHVLVAVSRYVGRFGVDYYNTKSTIERLGEDAEHKPANGLSAEIDNIVYRNAKGEAIIRFAPNWSAPHSKVYILDGEEVSKEALLAMGFSKSELHIKEGGTPPEVINLMASRIAEIK